MTKPTRAQLQKFAELVANMTNEREMVNGMPSEDAIATVNALIAEAREVTGLDPEHEEVYCVICDSDIEGCECERPGECVTCGTQCNEEGICALCSLLERAEERLREVTVIAGLPGAGPLAQRAVRAARRTRLKVLATEIESCRKCGAYLTLADTVNGAACADEGDGPEKGNVFMYCSEDCRESH